MSTHFRLPLLQTMLQVVFEKQGRRLSESKAELTTKYHECRRRPGAKAGGLQAALRRQMESDQLSNDDHVDLAEAAEAAQAANVLDQQKERVVEESDHVEKKLYTRVDVRPCFL